VRERICLPCDWTGEGDGAACPRCGAPLYRLPESTTRREVAPAPRTQPQPAGDPTPSSPIDIDQDEESVPPGVPVAASRRWWLIGGGAFTAAAVLIVATGLPFDHAQTPAVPGPVETGPTEAIDPVPSTDYLLDLNTGEITPLPQPIVRSLGGGEHQYAVSPDGSRVAYIGTRDDGPDLCCPPREPDNQIFIARIDGTGVRQVTHAPHGTWSSSPAWSPDGTRIAYEGGSGHHLGLYVLDVASGESTQITGVNVHYEHEHCVVGLDPGCFEGDTSLVPGQPLAPQFTPDGSSLVYTGGTNRHPVIWIVPVVGRKSTLYLRDAENVSLSPDGSLVTFLDNPAGGLGQRRWVADADGTNRRLLPELWDPVSVDSYRDLVY
jgi:hypothetical protein